MAKQPCLYGRAMPLGERDTASLTSFGTRERADGVNDDMHTRQAASAAKRRSAAKQNIYTTLAEGFEELRLVY